jgi:hypothetical protein
LRRLVLDGHPERLPKPVFFLPGHTAYHVALAEDGRTAASLSVVGRQMRPDVYGMVNVVHVWELATGKALARRELGFSVGFEFLGFAPGVRGLAGSVSLLPPLEVKAARDESNTRQVVLQDVATGRRLLTLPQPDYFSFVHAFAPDGRTLVTATSVARPTDRGTELGASTLRFWELATGKERLAIRSPGTGNRHHYVRLTFSPDGRTLATARVDRTLQVWDAVTGGELLRRADCPSDITALAFRPDGRALATGHRDSTILVWDVGPAATAAGPAAPAPGAKELEGWWSDLAGADARKAYAAVWGLARAPRQSVALLRGRLRPAPAVPAEEVRRLIADLDSADFGRREAASRRLEQLGEQVEAALEEALKAGPSAEQRRRVEQLLAVPRPVRSPEGLRAVRAVEVLEHVGRHRQAVTREARALLQVLAGGAPDARLTREAKASLERLAGRPPG